MIHIEYKNNFVEPYYPIPDIGKCTHNNSEEFVFEDNTSKENIAQVVANILDIPLAELSLADVKKEFSSTQYPISEEKAVQIMNYYNGRLALYTTIKRDIDDDLDNKTFNKRYDIPFAYNYFSCIDDENDTKQLESCISITKN